MIVCGELMNPATADVLFWLLCLGVTIVNAAIFRARAREYSIGNATILEEANQIVRTFVTYGGGLFLLMALGAALGLTNPLTSFNRHGPST